MAKTGRRPAGQTSALRDKISGLLLANVPPSQIASAVDLKLDTVYRHISAIRKEWAAENPGGSDGTRAELLAKARDIMRQAAAGAARARGGPTEVAFLKVQLEGLDRIAKLTGAYGAERLEITGANGGPVEMSSEHAIDALDDTQLAERMRAWAESLESTIIEGKVIELATGNDSTDTEQ
jgi:hypothetical protein